MISVLRAKELVSFRRNRQKTNPRGSFQEVITSQLQVKVSGPAFLFTLNPVQMPREARLHL